MVCCLFKYVVVCKLKAWFRPACVSCYQHCAPCFESSGACSWQLGTFTTPLKDGWGLAADGALLLASDGSSKLYWLDPAKNFSTVKSVTVKDGSRSIGYLNEVSAGWLLWSYVCMA